MVRRGLSGGGAKGRRMEDICNNNILHDLKTSHLNFTFTVIYKYYHLHFTGEN